MKTRRIVLALLTTAVLSTLLTGCGEDETEVLVDRVTQGEQANDAVDRAKELNQGQSEEIDKLLE